MQTALAVAVLTALAVVWGAAGYLVGRTVTRRQLSRAVAAAPRPRTIPLANTVARVPGSEPDRVWIPPQWVQTHDNRAQQTTD